MGTGARRVARPAILFTFAIALIACGGSSDPGSGAGAVVIPPPGGSAPPAAPPGGGTPPPPTQPPPNSTVPPAIAPIGAALPEDLPDSDNDGIPDHLDPYPQEAPLLAPLAGAGAFQLDRAWSELDGHALDGLAFAGRALYLEGRGLDGAAAGAWVVFQTLAGRTAVRPEERAGGGWQVTVPALATRVHVVLDNRRSGSLDLVQPDFAAPLVFPPQAGFEAGASAVVRGRNLAGVTHATLGETALQVLETGTDFLRLQLPPHTLGNTLLVSGATNSSNPVSLDVRREVIVELDASVPATTERPLRGYALGRRFALAPGQPATIEVAAHRPTVQLLDLELPSGRILHGAVGVVLWPDAPHATVSLASTLVTDLARITQGRREVTANGWSRQREVLEGAWSLPEAREFEAGLAAYLADGTLFPRYELRGRVMDELLVPAANDGALVDAPPAPGDAVFDDPAPQILSDGLGPAIGPGRRLDDAIPFTVSLGAPERPDMPQGTYAQFTVTTHNETFLGFNVCRFPGGLPPAGITPSDLCVQNSTPMPASAAVYLPNRFTYGAPYTPRDSDRVRSHVDRLIDGNAFRNSATYLTADTNVPLCGMRPCYVELLTGGLGLGHKVSLSTNEESIVQLLRLRWILEEFVVDALFDLFGLSSDDNLRSCVVSRITADVGFIDAVSQFVLRTRANPGGAAGIFEETVGKHVIDMAVGTAANFEGVRHIYDCVIQQLPQETYDSLQRRVTTRLQPISKTLGNVFRFLTILNRSLYAGGILLTPEKMLFKVVYRGEITEFNAFRGEDTDYAANDIDLYDVRFPSGNDRTLRIYGDWIANTALTSSEDSFYPTLVFRDRRGATANFPLDASHLIDEGGAQRQLAVSLPEIGFGTGSSPSNALADLDSGPLEFWLEYSHPEFAAYPAGVLRIPSPARIGFNGIGRITAFSPPSAAAGSQVTASGNRLEDFSERPRVVFVSAATGVVESGPPVAASVRNGKLIFTVPTSLPQGSYLVELHHGMALVDEILSSVPLIVTPRPDPYVTLSDWRGDDDVIRVQLLPAGSTFALEEFQVPEVSGRFVAAASWDRGAPIDRLRVICDDPGNDATCTYRLRLEDAEIELPDGVRLRDYSGQLLRGEDVIYPVRVLP